MTRLVLSTVMIFLTATSLTVTRLLPSSDPRDSTRDRPPTLAQQTYRGPKKKDTDRRRRQRSSLLFGGTDMIQFLVALAILHQDDLKKGLNSSYSSYRPGVIHPIFISSWCNSSYSSNLPGAFHLILQIVLVQNSYCSTAKKWIDSVPQAAATTFAFSSVFIILLCRGHIEKLFPN